LICFCVLFFLNLLCIVVAAFFVLGEDFLGKDLADLLDEDLADLLDEDLADL
jgi:hypothetical protein